MSSINTLQPQELSIQWIDIRRARKFVGAEKKEKIDNPTLIDRIVKVYNNSNSSQSIFKSVDTNWKPAFNFKVKVYEKVSKITPVLAKVLEKSGAGKREKRVNSEYLLFLYRTKPREEIVALTSDQAWHAVRGCINFEAPSMVAKYILDPEKIQSFTRCCILSGHVETVSHPTGLEFHTPTAIYYLMESFKCLVKSNEKLEEDSPILKIECLNSMPTVKVSKGLLRIKRRIPLGEYPQLLNLFSTYLSGKSKENIDPQFEFLQFLQPATVSKDTLDEALVDNIVKHYLEGEEQTVFIQYKYFNDFMSSDSYQIQVKAGGHYKDCEKDRKPITVENIIWYFVQYVDNPLPEEMLRGCLQQANLRFTGTRGGEMQASLLDFLSGEVRYEGTAYYKLKGMWYELHVDYMAIVTEEFRKLLKKSLLESNDSFQLPNPWMGSEKQGHVTLTELNKFVKLEKKEKEKLEQFKGSYINEKDKKPVNVDKLEGEILKDKKIKEKQKEIETAFGKHSTVAVLKTSITKIDKTFWGVLTAKRPIFKKEGQKYYVVTPFTHPLADKLLDGVTEDEFKEFLKAKGRLYSLGCEMEEDYNRSYFYDSMGRKVLYDYDEGYLVFDQITPLGIEPCDILKYTDTKTYLYHVKEDLGQHTRDACSQILNAAKIIRSSLSAQQPKNYFHMLWEEGIKTVGSNKKPLAEWRLKIAAQLKAIGEKDFLKLFTKRKLVFVYAILQQPNRSLHKEVKLRSRLRPKDIDETQGEEIYKKLQDSQYLDSQGRIATQFLDSAQTRFEVEGLEKKTSGEVYKKIAKYKSVSKSSIAKFDLIQLAESLKILGFKLKICEIQKKGLEKEKIDSLENESYDDENLNTQQSGKASSGKKDDSSKKMTGNVEVQRDPVEFEEGVPNWIRNGGNSCYISSILWAISHSFTEKIKEFLSTEPKLQELNSIIVNLMKGILSNQEMEISTHEINQFRSSMQLFYPDAFSKDLKGNIKRTEQEDSFDFMSSFISHCLELKVFELHRFSTLHLFEEVSTATQLDGYDYEKALSPSAPPLKDFIATLKLLYNKQNTSISELISVRKIENFNRELFPLEDNNDLVKEYIEVSHTEEIIIPQSGYPPTYFMCRLARFDKIKGKEVKRFDQVEMNDIIEIPIKDVNNNAVIDSNQKASYHLNAVIIHSGSGINKGHYYCYLKREDGTWLVCDDIAGIFNCPNNEQVKQDQSTNGYIAIYKLSEE